MPDQPTPPSPLDVPISPNVFQHIREFADGRLGKAIRECVCELLDYGRMADEHFSAMVQQTIREELASHLANLEIPDDLWTFYGPEQDADGPTWWEAKTAQVGGALDEAIRGVFEEADTPGPLILVVREVLQRYARLTQEPATGLDYPCWFRWWPKR